MALKSSFKCNFKPYWLLKEREENIPPSVAGAGGSDPVDGARKAFGHFYLSTSSFFQAVCKEVFLHWAALSTVGWCWVSSPLCCWKHPLPRSPREGRLPAAKSGQRPRAAGASEHRDGCGCAAEPSSSPREREVFRMLLLCLHGHLPRFPSGLSGERRCSPRAQAGLGRPPYSQPGHPNSPTTVFVNG